MRVTGDVVGEVGEGLCVLPGVTHGDGRPQIEKTTWKIIQLHMLREVGGDDDTRRSTEEAGASVLLVSQFTLYTDVRKRRSPGWSHAALNDVVEPVVVVVTEELHKVYGLHVETGKLGAVMDVELADDGPFTLLIGA